MKSVSGFVLLLVTADCLSSVIPPTDDSIEHVVDNFSIPSNEIDDKEQQWELIPDTDGHMHLVDLNSYDFSLVPLFDAFKEMKFVLFTRNSSREEITMNLTSLEASNFNKNRPTRFTIHGWNGDETSLVNTRVIEEYLSLGDFNCVMVDWSRGAGTLDYIAARNRLYSVANVTARFIEFLHRHDYLNYKMLHIVGHSLGAHVAGLIGKYVESGKVAAIFGLDPAGPLFYVDSPEARLSETDATYVEVLHTNGFTLGFGHPLGDADFYPNFGRWQPGCGIEFIGTCSHGRAPELFAESIKDSNFEAIRCSSSAEIGKDRCTNNSTDRFVIMRPEPANYGLRGYFFFETNKFNPFAIALSKK